MSMVISSSDRPVKQVCPPVESPGSRWMQIRRRCMSAIYCFPDHGWFGLTPLRQHVLICGFPRSGTTLLQLMLENAMPHARRFGREVGGWRAATYKWRNHDTVISKVPHDVFRLQRLRAFYATRRAELKIILMIRDPRDVLTSQRETGGPAGYVVPPARWRSFHEAVSHERTSPDCLTVRYEDLVARPADEQARVSDFLGVTMAVPFEQFHTPPRPDFAIETLNGLRPLEATRVSRWTHSRHEAHLELCRKQLPELAAAIEAYGYSNSELTPSLL